MSENIKKLEFSFIDHEKEIIIEDVLEKYLVSIGKINFFQQLSYILKEMVGNANKANLKRIHFFINNLDINFSSHYQKGMQTFKEAIGSLSSKYMLELKEMGHYVKIGFGTVNNSFVMSVINSSEILPFEKERLENKLKSAIRFKSMEEAFSSEGLDTSEGAGFGLILTMLMLRKIGLDESVFQINNKEKHTETQVAIPLSLLDKEQEEVIAKILEKEIKEIPQFPQHIIELEKILANPNANFSDLSLIIDKDPSLIADLLKVANSSMYMLPIKVKTIKEAVRQIGFKGVRNLVLTYSAQKILMNKYNLKLIKDVMAHSIEVAFYAYEIARKLNLKDIIDQIYTAAILHDFGKIIISSLNPDITDKISRLCNEKGISPHIVENLTNGFNHSIIGAKLAEKWNFSEALVETIKYHHIPLEASSKNQKLVYIVYLANILYYYKRDQYEFLKINYQVLKYLNLTEQKEFEKLGKTIITTLEGKKEKGRSS